MINVAVTEGSQVKVAELVSQDWAEIGFTTVVKPTSNPVLHQLVESNESDITVFHLDRAGESFGARGNPYWSYPGDSQFWTAWPWTVWFKTHGEAGEEPPESWKAWMKDWDAWFQTETGSPEYMELAHKVYDFVSSELFVIGTVGMSPVGDRLQRGPTQHSAVCHLELGCGLLGCLHAGSVLFRSLGVWSGSPDELIAEGKAGRKAAPQATVFGR